MANIIAYNVRGLNTPRKRRLLFDSLKRMDVDIACLQETHIRRGEESRLKSIFYTQQFFSSIQTKKRGVAILIRKNIPFRLIDTKKDNQGRYIMIKGEIDGLKTTIVSVYAPNSDQNIFFQALFQEMGAFAEGNIILGGGLEFYNG